MKTNFYIHGVLKGQEIWGSEQDRDYIKSIYSAPNNRNEQVRFVVEIIPTKKKTYYTYIREKNVFGAENREGSYFGMTVSFDGVYCTDNESLFTLFDTVFNKRIIGTLLQNQNGNFRFAVASFEGKNKELESIQTAFLKQLDSFAEDLDNIDNSFHGTLAGQIPLYNISDIDNSSFFNVLRKTLKVFISPEYPTRDAQIASLRKQIEPEKAKNKQLLEEKGELESKLSASIEKNKRYEAELASFRGDKQKLDEENKKLRTENASLKTDLERNKAKNGIEKSVNLIKQPLDELLRHIRKISPAGFYYDELQHHHDESPKSGIGNKRMVVHEVVLGIILILLIGLTTIIIIDIVSPKFFQKSNGYVSSIPQGKPYHRPYIKYKENFSELEVAKEYEAELINSPQGIPIRWRIDGAEVPDGKKNENIIKFKPLADKDSVYLTSCLVINNKDSIIEKKRWHIKK